ncbi:MAG: DUF4328 domain-containing protein [Leptospiraceae bacterium]|nr:DUF4328 domain-containing protein [Leptospiraceae bacterium]
MNTDNPYQVNVPLDTKPAPPAGYRPLEGSARFMNIILKSNCGVSAFWLISQVLLLVTLHQISTGQGGSFNYMDAELNAPDVLVGVAGLLLVLTYLASVIGSIVWIHRAHNNLPFFGAKNLRITPGWAIGWFFVPIANLWKPYEGMKQLYQASKEPAAWKWAEVPGFMGLWWFLWVVTSILDRIISRFSDSAQTLDEFLVLTYANVAVAPLGIILPLVYNRVIQAITRLQEERLETVDRISESGEEANGTGGSDVSRNPVFQGAAEDSFARNHSPDQNSAGSDGKAQDTSPDSDRSSSRFPSIDPPSGERDRFGR